MSQETTLQPGPETAVPRGGFAARVRWRMLGSAAPVFPGFEIDICDPSPDREKADAEWHNDRVRRMLVAHPEVRRLIKPNPFTAVLCVLVAALQVGLACAAGLVPWWVVLLVAYVGGSLISLNLFMLAHECNHGLVFRSARLNRWLYTLVSLPMGQPGHHTWWIEHHVHHSDLGAKKDFIKRRRTFFLLADITSPLFFPFAPLMLVLQIMRSVLGLLMYVAGLFVGRLTPGRRTLAVLADVHLVSGYQKYRFPVWAAAYAGLSLALFGGVFLVAGWHGVVYLLGSTAFMCGFLNPMLFGMMLSNSHFHGAAHYQPSSSYYGWLNRLTLNFGLHTEHHDISSVPWNKLPELRRRAPDFYDPLHQTTSYTALALKFVFGSKEVFAQQFDNETLRNVAMLRGADDATLTPCQAT